MGIAGVSMVTVASLEECLQSRVRFKELIAITRVKKQTYRNMCHTARDADWYQSVLEDKRRGKKKTGLNEGEKKVGTLDKYY